MGNRVSPELSRLLSERKITRAQISRDMILKEIEAAETDLKDAKDSFENDKFKWATIQSYYSMFHSARALLLRIFLISASFRFTVLQSFF